MRLARRANRHPPRVQPKDESGTKLCRCGCGVAPKKPRRTFATNECVHAFRSIYDPGYIRELVYKRDRGVCQICGIHASKAFKEWCAARKEAHRLVDRLARAWEWDNWRVKRYDPTKKDWDAFHREKKAMVERLVPLNGWTTGRSTGWDADHIIPVAKGGLQLGIENIRTLCHPCHKKVTAELAAELARERNPQPDPRHGQQQLLDLGDEQTQDPGTASAECHRPEPEEPPRPHT